MVIINTVVFNPGITLAPLENIPPIISLRFLLAFLQRFLSGTFSNIILLVSLPGLSQDSSQGSPGISTDNPTIISPRILPKFVPGVFQIHLSKNSIQGNSSGEAISTIQYSYCSNFFQSNYCPIASIYHHLNQMSNSKPLKSNSCNRILQIIEK